MAQHRLPMAAAIDASLRSMMVIPPRPASLGFRHRRQRLRLAQPVAAFLVVALARGAARGGEQCRETVALRPGELVAAYEAAGERLRRRRFAAGIAARRLDGER